MLKGFLNCLEKQTPYNTFVGIILQDAINNSGKSPVIDYSNMAVADGMYPDGKRVSRLAFANELVWIGVKSSIIDICKANSHRLVKNRVQ